VREGSVSVQRVTAGIARKGRKGGETNGEKSHGNERSVRPMNGREKHSKGENARQRATPSPAKMP